MIEAARAIVVAVAMAVTPCPAHGTPLEKWIEPRHFDAKTYTIEWETYWVFESDWDSDLGRRTYSQRQVSQREFEDTEVVSWPEGDEEPG